MSVTDKWCRRIVFSVIIIWIAMLDNLKELLGKRKAAEIGGPWLKKGSENQKKRDDYQRDKEQLEKERVFNLNYRQEERLLKKLNKF